jgi:NAD(P)-dependent dehydrogenase (short-subunit alcohol dehydrogenase family)
MADATRFAGRVALITGGASGIGLASARRMTAEGGRVLLWDVDVAALERARAEFGDVALCQRVDVTREDDVASALDHGMAQFGRLDIVVNSAGITGPTEPFWLHTTASWRRVLDLNLDAVFFVSRAAVPHLIAAGGGRIVNLASIAGKEGNRHQAAYSASKAGVIGLTKSMGKDLVEHGILVNAIAPAAIEGELIKQMPPSQIDFVRAKIPMNRLGRLEEVAALVCWLASGDCSFNTGAVFDLSGGRATY